MSIKIRIILISLALMVIFPGTLISTKQASSKVYNQSTSTYPLKNFNLISNEHFIPQRIFKSKRIPKFIGLNMSEDSIQLNFEGKPLNLSLPIYLDTNRYFLPLTEVISDLNGKTEIGNNTVIIELNNLVKTIGIKSDTHLFYLDGKQIKLTKKLTIINDIVYISMVDFCMILDLKTTWDVDHRVLSFYFNREKPDQKHRPTLQKPALIRLEDIAAGHLYNQPESLEKLRIITDYLYTENIPFHVAWVPRYIDPRPSSLLDNDISKQDSMLNADFVYTLDYMLEKNGLIGLHGYTHQYKNTESVGGTEFHQFSKDGIPETEQYAQERVTLAIKAAEKLQIPYSFFEVPHYAITIKQVKVIEKSFATIYENYPDEPKQINAKKNDDKTTKYIPTPLDYVNGKSEAPKMIQRINNLKDGTLASFFYHPHLEFSEIKISHGVDGYPLYTYSEKSILHQIVRLFNDKGYRFVTINEIN